MTTAIERCVSARDAARLPGAGLDWLDRLRDDGARRFGERGFPTLKDENWRYTNLRPILKKDFEPIRLDAEEPARDALDPSFMVPGLDAHRFVFVNGRYRGAMSEHQGLPPGVTALPMAQAVSRGPDEVRSWLGACVPDDDGAFTALNTAFIEDGLYLRLAPGCAVERPIELVYVGQGAEGRLIQPRNLVVVGDNAEVRLVERYVSAPGSGHLTNAVTEIAAGDGCRIEHTRVQEEDVSCFHIGGLFMRLGAGAQVVSNNVALGSTIARTNLLVDLAGEGAACDLNGAYLASGRQHIDNFTQVDHRVPGCRSNEYYKGVLDDRARAVFHGRVIVRQGAQQTDAQQQNRNLLLSRTAEVDTKPQLEIYADDVKCSHGATVGQLDDAAMFYLRTRGIDETTARALLTYAFAADVINRLSLAPIRAHLEAGLGRKMFGVDRVEELG